jgi:hypothetical protein
MALKIERNGDLLQVIETIHSFTSTRRTYWYYDVGIWWKSSRGREGDIPDRPMTPEDIEWVQKHYLPKVGAKP